MTTKTLANGGVFKGTRLIGTGGSRCESIQIPDYNLDKYLQCVHSDGHPAKHRNQFGGEW